jgi:hypothetical protein
MPLKTNPPEKAEEKFNATNQPGWIDDPTLSNPELSSPSELDA